MNIRCYIIKIYQSKDSSNYIRVTHTASTIVFVNNSQVLESREWTDHRSANPGRVSALPIKIYLQLFSVFAQLFVHSILEAMQHWWSSTENGVFHDFLPEIFRTFVKTCLNHLRETFIVAYLPKDDFARRINQLFRKLDNSSVGKLV